MKNLLVALSRIALAGRKSGKLRSDAKWQPGKVEYLDPLETNELEVCAHCGKPIKTVVSISSEDGEYKVGVDCAEALTTGEARTQVEKIIKTEKDKTKAIRDRSLKVFKRGLMVYKGTDLKEHGAVKKVAEAFGENWIDDQGSPSVEAEASVKYAMRSSLEKDKTIAKWPEYIEEAISSVKNKKK